MEIEEEMEEKVACLKIEEDVKDLICETQVLEKPEEMIEEALSPIKVKRSIFLFQEFRYKLK